MAGAAASGDKIVKPGYHIRPKYDLHGLRRRRTNNHKGHVAGELPLTSMIDMFSILVIYLLMNFSATGEIFFLNKNLALPKAGKTNPLASSPLISIVNENFILDTPPDFDVSAPIEDSSPSLDRITGHLKTLKEVVAQKNIDAGNRVNVQASEDTEIGLIKRAMTAAVAAGWTNVNFVVEKQK
jgi:biopolymer transport protein ExbD